MTATDEPITFGKAEELILEVYGDWSEDDPDWWSAMVDSVIECGSVEAAREWLRSP